MTATRRITVRCWMLALTIAVVYAQLAWCATWPVAENNGGAAGAANRNMFQGYFDGSPNSGFVAGMHEGIDILASGNGGEIVRAVRAGTVIQRDGGNGGEIFIRSSIGGGLFETDAYLHVTLTNPVALDGNVAEGAILGTINNAAFAAGSNHLHYSVFQGTRNLAGTNTPGGIVVSAVTVASLRNPYQRFTADADRDPGGNAPALTDTNLDGRTVLLVAQGNTNPNAVGYTPLFGAVSGSIDIIADVLDRQATGNDTGAGPHKVGYSVQALFNQEAFLGEVSHHDIKSPAAPYLLARFDDNWAAGTPAMTTLYADSGTGWNNVTDTPAGGLKGELRVQSNGTIFPSTKQYIVTNTAGGSGAPANAQAGQFWRTDALDDNSADVADTANGVGMGTTAQNASARFRDGDYAVNIHMGDVLAAHDTNEVPGKVRLNNFTQTSAAALGGAPAPLPGPFSLDPLYSVSLPFLPNHAMNSETADPGPVFRINDLIGVEGQQYYPNLRMMAWLFPHQLWADGEEFPTPIATGLVESDANGDVPLTQFWVADQGGWFDLIIDYDRDQRFSATLDGLSSFSVVVPEPSSIVLVALGALLVLRRKKR